MEQKWIAKKGVKRRIVVVALLVLIAGCCAWVFREQPLLFWRQDKATVSDIYLVEYYQKDILASVDKEVVLKAMQQGRSRRRLTDFRFGRSFEPSLAEWRIGFTNLDSGEGFFLYIGREGTLHHYLRWSYNPLVDGAYYTITNPEEVLELLETLVQR